MMRERWLVVKEVGLEMPGQPARAYAVLPGFRTFPTAELAHVALDGLARYLGAPSDSLGWVVMPLSQLLPDLVDLE